jgi:hypothetical protein
MAYPWSARAMARTLCPRRCSSRIACRTDCSSMLLLLAQALGQAGEFLVRRGAEPLQF